MGIDIVDLLIVLSSRLLVEGAGLNSLMLTSFIIYTCYILDRIIKDLMNMM